MVGHWCESIENAGITIGTGWLDLRDFGVSSSIKWDEVTYELVTPLAGRYSKFRTRFQQNRENREIMATTTAAPATTTQETEKKAPLILTPQAIAKVREIMATQDPLPAGLRIGVVGGGCSGFQYSMAFENQAGMMDKVFKFDDLKVFVDATSLMYLNGCIVDYVETLEAAGFKFENPQVKSTCGCGSSFSV
jgi:iron-sulfur cluster assembly accessory protein